MSTDSAVRAALGKVHDPHCDLDLISSGAVRGVGVDGSRVAVEIQLGYPAAGWHAALEAQVR